MVVANTLAYYDMATIKAIKDFIMQAPGGAKITFLNLLLHFVFLAPAL